MAAKKTSETKKTSGGKRTGTTKKPPSTESRVIKLEKELREALEKLKQSQERYTLATEGSNAGMWDWDITHDKMHWSGLLLRMLGIRQKKFVPSLEELKNRIHETDRQDVVDILDAHLERGFEFDVEFRMDNGNGAYFWAHASGQALWSENKKPVRMIGFIYDATPRRKALESLMRSNESLERFAYVCSHDLKEPARCVQSFTKLVINSYSKKLDKRGREYLTFIHDNAERMQEMIKGILDYSQLESKNLAMEEIDTKEEFHKVLKNLKLSIDEKAAKITHGKLPKINADRMQIFQVLQNLIGNALKFCKDRKPHIHVTAKQQNGDWLFSVKDNGIGMKEEQTHKIFNVFQRLNKKEDYPGTGIGLSICQKVIQQHGGDIWVESEPGKGSTFFFTMPQTRIKRGGVRSGRQFKKAS